MFLKEESTRKTLVRVIRVRYQIDQQPSLLWLGRKEGGDRGITHKPVCFVHSGFQMSRSSGAPCPHPALLSREATLLAICGAGSPAEIIVLLKLGDSH